MNATRDDRFDWTYIVIDKFMRFALFVSFLFSHLLYLVYHLYLHKIKNCFLSVFNYNLL
jgi:hypothetical protein